MSLLTRRAAIPRVDTDERGGRHPIHADHVRVVRPQAEDEDHTQDLVQGSSADRIEQLLLAIANGDADALAVLERHVGGLVRVNIRRVLRDASRSDAVTREFFADVLRDPTGFDPDRGSAMSWLLTRAHQQAASGLTARTTREVASGSTPPPRAA